MRSRADVLQLVLQSLLYWLTLTLRAQWLNLELEFVCHSCEWHLFPSKKPLCVFFQPWNRRWEENPYGQKFLSLKAAFFNLLTPTGQHLPYIPVHRLTSGWRPLLLIAKPTSQVCAKYTRANCFVRPAVDRFLSPRQVHSWYFSLGWDWSIFHVCLSVKSLSSVDTAQLWPLHEAFPPFSKNWKETYSLVFMPALYPWIHINCSWWWAVGDYSVAKDKHWARMGSHHDTGIPVNLLLSHQRENQAVSSTVSIVKLWTLLMHLSSGNF